MNVLLLKLSPQQNRLTIRREGIRITCLKLNSKTHIYFAKNFMKFYLIFVNLINFFHHMPNLTAELATHREKIIFVISNDNKAMKI